MPSAENHHLPQFEDGKKLTHSSMKCWNACRRRYYFAYVLGVRKFHQSEPLRIGSMWHLGVGLYEGGMPIDDAVAAVRQAYAEKDRPPYFTDEEYAVEEEKVCAMIRAHHHVYRDDPYIQTVAIEQSFAVPIVNPETGARTPSFVSAGMIDRIGKVPDDSEAVIERKTTSENIEPDSAYWQALRNDPQISRYFLAASVIGHDITTVIYDVVKKPQIRPRDVAKAQRALANSDQRYYSLKLTEPCPDHETPAMYGARLLADMTARPEHYFARKHIARTDGDLIEFQFDLWQTQQEIQQAMRTGRYYRNPASCLEPYTCEYIGVCHELYADPKTVPEGFRRVARLHEELSETKGATHDSRTTEPTTAAVGV